jgi:glucosamine--fructose-6-phosphate aminotransferase (isomerizing)
MCGIVGYIGQQQAKSILLDCLGRLEYRGYDSSGIAVRNSSDNLEVYKDAVRVAVLRDKSPQLNGTIGIAHTRWATHGAPSIVNAHPHLDCTGKFAVVHNGVITNFQELKEQLMSEGHVIASETDTEVIPHLIEKFYKGDLETAVKDAIAILKGSYSIIVISQYEPNLVVAKNGSPLVIGIGDSEKYISSDVPAIIKYTDRVTYLEDGDLGVITGDSIKITRNGEEPNRKEQRVVWCKEEVQMVGYEHYMIKEIREQPKVIVNTIMENTQFNPMSTLDRGTQDLAILACGTSYNAGLIGEYVVEELTGIPTRVCFASEFNHRRTVHIDEAIVITQSGETADVLTAMKTLQALKVKVLAITNVPGSTASRIANRTIFIKAGPEVSVAATKSFIAQLVALYQLVSSHPSVDPIMREQLIAELNQLPTKVERLFDLEPQIVECAKYISKYNDAFFIGRGINYPVALEGALKLKEISYVHAEGFAAGELKHGPFALLTQGVPVIAITAQDANYDAMLVSIKEVKARSAYVIALADENDEIIDHFADNVLKVPHTHKLLSPIMNTIPLQLLAYYTAKFKGCPIDFPRNLAKSVTVE